MRLQTVLCYRYTYNMIFKIKQIIYSLRVSTIQMKGGKSGRTVKGTYWWWGEVKWSEVHVKIGVQYPQSNNIRN